MKALNKTANKNYPWKHLPFVFTVHYPHHCLTRKIMVGSSNIRNNIKSVNQENKFKNGTNSMWWHVFGCREPAHDRKQVRRGEQKKSKTKKWRAIEEFRHQIWFGPSTDGVAYGVRFFTESCESTILINR